MFLTPRIARWLALLVLASSAVIAGAHPAIGIVIDRGGNIYYSDLTHVWRVAPNGSKTIVVPNVHTHELYLDDQGNLYGEHLWYEGEKIDRWGHYVWRRTTAGRIERVIPAREGFLQNYSFVRDARGIMYWAERERGVIRKRMPDGRIVDHARGHFNDLRWMTVTRDGTIWTVDKTDLLRIDSAGRIVRVAQKLSRGSIIRPWAAERHRLMGLAVDRNGHVLIADYAAGELKRITPSGAVSSVARSPYPWAPTGVVVAPDGSIWILEVTLREARVRNVK